MIPENSVKIAYNCRLLSLNTEKIQILKEYKTPQVGDVACFSVQSLGKFKRLLNAHCVNQTLFPGDLIIAAFGNRYASNQFEGYVPKEARFEYDLLSQGGTVGTASSWHTHYAAGPAKLIFKGYVTDEKGQILNTLQPPKLVPLSQPLPSVLLSIGSSMDSGKTTSAAYLVRGLKQARKKVAYLKLTGTTYYKDTQLARDAGADIGLDFSDLGYPSTYLLPIEEVKAIFINLINRAIQAVQPDFVVVEIADGLLQRETTALLKDPSFMQMVSGTFLSIGDSLGAIGALDTLARMQITPLALCGLFTASPLMVKEVQENSSLPILGLAELANPLALLPVLAPPVAGSTVVQTGSKAA